MNARLYRTALGRSPVHGERLSPALKAARISFGQGLRCGLVALVVASGIWMLLPLSKGHSAEPVGSGMVMVEPSAPGDAATAVPPMAQASPAADLEHLRISSQTWRRGGLGSKALVTLTLRNDNDYAVRDLEIVCAFARRDGTHLTDRSRVLPDTVNMKSRKTFARVAVGVINVNADQAKCSLIAARRA
jgi:hypothetical protein